MPLDTELIGLDDAEDYFRSVPGVSRKAARLAINQTMKRGGMDIIKTEMLEQAAFPAGYLGDERLGVTKYATEGDLSGTITGRMRPTSLARFAAPGTPIGSFNGGGVKVTVKKGQTRFLRNAWLVKLNRGEKKSPDSFNLGLAVRVNPGESIGGKYSKHKSWLVPGSIALLYGPSVDQIFRDVRESSGPAILDLVGTEFLRQFERLS